MASTDFPRSSNRDTPPAWGPYRDIIKVGRPLSSRVPMDRLRRAKQFAPFAALRGFESSIEETTQLSQCTTDE